MPRDRAKGWVEAGGDVGGGLPASKMLEPLELEGTIHRAAAEEVPKFNRDDDQGREGIGMKLVSV